MKRPAIERAGVRWGFAAVYTKKFVVVADALGYGSRRRLRRVPT